MKVEMAKKMTLFIHHSINQQDDICKLVQIIRKAVDKFTNFSSIHQLIRSPIKSNIDGSLDKRISNSLIMVQIEVMEQEIAVSLQNELHSTLNSIHKFNWIEVFLFSLLQQNELFNNDFPDSQLKLCNKNSMSTIESSPTDYLPIWKSEAENISNKVDEFSTNCNAKSLIYPNLENVKRNLFEEPTEDQNKDELEKMKKLKELLAPEKFNFPIRPSKLKTKITQIFQNQLADYGSKYQHNSQNLIYKSISRQEKSRQQALIQRRLNRII